MKILYIAHKPPVPTVDGGCVAMKSSLDLLIAAGYDVSLFSLYTPKHRAPTQNERIQNLKQEYHFIDTELKATQALKHLVINKNYNLSRFYSAEIAQTLMEKIEQEGFDLIHVESLFSLVYISNFKATTSAPVVYRSHNIEHSIWDDLSKETSNPLKRVYLKKLAKSLKKEELKLTKLADFTLSINSTDTKVYRSWGIKNCDTLLPSVELSNSPQANTGGVYHLGAMDWQPNLDGVNWLVDHVLPLLKDTDIKIHLAGRNMPGIWNEQAQLVIDGEVEDARTYIEEKQICLIPVFSGSGVKMKLLEALAAGKAIITTDKGIEGVDLKHNQEVFIANSPQAFADGIIGLSKNPKQVADLSKGAYQWAKENLSKESQKASLDLLYRKLSNS